MELIPVKSSNVKAIGYKDGIIEVHFRNGYVYHYIATQTLFEQFLSASSKGRFVHQHLKHLPTRRIR